MDIENYTFHELFDDNYYNILFNIYLELSNNNNTFFNNIN